MQLPNPRESSIAAHVATNPPCRHLLQSFHIDIALSIPTEQRGKQA